MAAWAKGQSEVTLKDERLMLLTFSGGVVIVPTMQTISALRLHWERNK